jgi:hypothetical protein
LKGWKSLCPEAQLKALVVPSTVPPGIALMSNCTFSGFMIIIASQFEIPDFELQMWWAHQDSNLGPTGYEPVALAN